MNNPAQLWIGNQQILKKEIITFLQKELCKNSGCASCNDCKKIEAQQHHAVMWIIPEKQYSLNLLEPIIETMAFRNEEDKSFYFILEKADLLTHACANSLLKSVEEPPAGYKFIFLAQRIDAILPTIRSRCAIKIFHEEPIEIAHESFLHHFKVKTDPISFLQALDHTQPNEQESIELMDSLMHFWNLKYIKKPNQNTEKIITILQQSIKKPPMPGGSKIFWKNIYLALNFHLSKQN